MSTGFISAAGKFTVERISVPHDLIPVDMSKPPAGVLHTTEGGWAGSLSVFKQHFAPHFMVGRDTAVGRVRIAQFVPINFMAAALENASGGVETNRWARVQIEIVGFSSLKPWLPGDDVVEALATLFDKLHEVADIPLSRPFSDVIDPGTTWASPSNPRRRSGKWGKEPGWFHHMEVPENAHWDCGALQVRDIFAQAPSRQPRLIGYTVSYTTRAGERTTANISNPEQWMETHPDAKKRGSVVFRRRFA